jgi:hypothetical protein
MEIHQQRAFEYLSEKEQTILSLVTINDRSFKEVATIMDISPYKVKEIYFRAKRYFVMFSDHFETYDTIFPKEPMFDPIFLKYVEGLLRRDINIEEDPYYVSITLLNTRNILWGELLETLSKTQSTKDGHALASLNLILEFDKWSEKRILPKAYQKPSGFDRRRLKAFKKLKDKMLCISDIGWQYITNKFGAKEFTETCLVRVSENDWQLVPITINTQSFMYCTQNGLLIFDSRRRATEFGELVYQFEKHPNKTTQVAHKFWSNFRILIFYSINIEELLKIKKDEFLEMTEKDKLFLQKVKEKIRKIPKYKASDPNLFW